jgi:hypothetical protein
MSEQACEACDGKGWVICNTGNDQSPEHQIQRCDACERYDNDWAACETAIHAAGVQPKLLRFVEEVARLTHEGEPGDEGEPFEPASEDAIATLNQLIVQARRLINIADECSECGATVPYIIGCPDGYEICQDCFDAGQH